MAHCANEGYKSAIGAPAHDGAAMLKAEKTQGARMCKSAERVASSACYFKGHVTRCGDRRSNQERNTWTEGQIVNTTHTTSKGKNSLRMDFTDVGIRHTILNSVQLHHFIDFSPSAAVIAKEARLCVIAIVVGWVTTSVVSSICNRKCERDSVHSKR